MISALLIAFNSGVFSELRGKVIAHLRNYRLAPTFFFFFFPLSLFLSNITKWKENGDWGAGGNCIRSAKYRVLMVGYFVLRITGVSIQTRSSRWYYVFVYVCAISLSISCSHGICRYCLFNCSPYCETTKEQKRSIYFLPLLMHL